MSNWKKRGQAGWNGRKTAKERQYIERNYAKKEISKELQMIEEGDEFREKHKSKKVLTDREKLEKRLHWYERTLERWTRPNKEAQWQKYDQDSWFSRYVNSLRDKVKKLREELGK